ncbi:SecDF P1 head subdomain-containing protein [Actinokineospora enzanensis]|uniref:SecDF P1 head subdomain-containing protein n=1 Tax=Actinokineospora enzanensis TaxID=155975 RepID=UPI000378EA37|nr:hypothetical protein [Actinokineospora enzanensis]
MRKVIGGLLACLLTFGLVACGDATVQGVPVGQGSPAAGTSGGPIEAKVPVELRPVTNVSPSGEPSGPDQFLGKDGAVYTLAAKIGEFTRFTKLTAEVEPQTGQWMVVMELPADSSALFAKWTSEHVGEQLAFVVDGKLVSAPTIQAAITAGAVQISGGFDKDSARQLVDDIIGR